MTQRFINRVIHDKFVDTKQYRYAYQSRSAGAHQYPVIERLPIAHLNTTAAIDGWEIVWSGENNPQYLDTPSIVRTGRIECSMTQQQLGELCGYSGALAQVQVAEWESGRRPIPRDKIKTIAKTLGIPIGQLLP